MPLPIATNNPYAPYLQQSLYQGYQQMPMQAPSYVSPYQQQQPTNGIIQVNGPESAMQFSMAPNSTSPALFDNNGRVFYIVTTDGTGMKTLETFDYSKHVERQSAGADVVTRAELDSLTNRVSMLETSNGIHGQVQPAIPAASATEQPAQ